MPEIFQALFDELAISKASLGNFVRSMQREDMPAWWIEEVVDIYNEIDEYMTEFKKTWIDGPAS